MALITTESSKVEIAQCMITVLYQSHIVPSSLRFTGRYARS